MDSLVQSLFGCKAARVWGVSLLLYNVILFAAQTVQLTGQRLPCQASHIERLQFPEQIMHGLHLIRNARLLFAAKDLVVHIEYIDALVHDANVIVMIVRKEVQIGAQLLGDQCVHLVDFHQKYNDIGARVQGMSGGQYRYLHNTTLAADELRFVGFQCVERQQRGVGLM